MLERVLEPEVMSDLQEAIDYNDMDFSEVNRSFVRDLIGYATQDGLPLGPDILDADRYATAAFAMGRQGVAFVEALPGFEAYQIGTDGVATMTSGFRSLARL